MKEQKKVFTNFQMPMKLYKKLVDRMLKDGFTSELETKSYINYILGLQLNKDDRTKQKRKEKV
ncbi:hypothetical protein M0R19_01955 [Candidatus Pacearchaeota archaeon]|nr:hypothetical protein [Candidatus Pacearchaeota archaeon]